MKKILLLIILVLTGCSKQLTSLEIIPKDGTAFFAMEKQKLSLIMVGDGLINSRVYNSAKTSTGYDFKPMLKEIKPIIKKYDLAFYNQETIIGGPALGFSSFPRFNSPEEIGDAMVDSGFNLISIANNHSFDKGEEGINYSLKYWKSKNVIFSGMNETEEAKNNIPIYEKNGITFAFIAYTNGDNHLSADVSKHLVNMYNHVQAKNDIAKIRDKVDVVITSVHTGTEYEQEPDWIQLGIAKNLEKSGADIVIMNHPHVIQQIDKINNTYIFYSLGNFIYSKVGRNAISQNIGLMPSLDITKLNGEMTIENFKYDLTYVYYNEINKQYTIYPFSKLTDKILPNYKQIEKEYRNIVDKKIEN